MPRKKGHNGQREAVFYEKQGGTIGSVLLFCAFDRDKSEISTEEDAVIVPRADGGEIVKARHACAAVTYGNGVVAVIGSAVEDDGVADLAGGARCGVCRSEKRRRDGLLLEIRLGQGREAECIRECGVGKVCAVGRPMVVGAVHDGSALRGAEGGGEIERIGEGGLQNCMGCFGAAGIVECGKRIAEDVDGARCDGEGQGDARCGGGIPKDTDGVKIFFQKGVFSFGIFDAVDAVAVLPK